MVGSTPFRGPDGNAADADGEALRPWLVSGAFCRHVVIPGFLDTSLDGVQLVTSVYVPTGYVGFVKGIRIAPFMPAYVAPNWQKAPGLEYVAGNLNTLTPQASFSYWETPAWECFGNFDDPESFPPFWRWHLTFVRGTLADNRIFPLAASPATFRFIPEIPVPRAAYPTGIPGDAAGWNLGDQKVPRVNVTADGSLHVPVPPDTTVCLWSEWRQATFDVNLQRFSVLDPSIDESFLGQQNIVALLPAWGTLAGYMQPRKAESALANAREGWGG